MQGWPVWLASVTLRDEQNRIRPTETWNDEDRERASASLELALTGLGDESRQRQFRMCSTMCRHRAVTPAEADHLPESWWSEAARDIAGGPVELLWERGLPPSPGSRPCEHPSWMAIDRRDPRLKFPIDCGECEPCRVRAACHSRPMLRPGAPA